MLTYRFGTPQDVDLLYKWANDESARQNSYNSDPIPYQHHVKWYEDRLHSGASCFYIFCDEDHPVGQVRIDNGAEPSSAIISISIDKEYRGKGLSVEMLQQATKGYLAKHQDTSITAYVFKSNLPSFKSFLKAGFEPLKEEVVKGVDSYILKYSL